MSLSLDAMPSDSRTMAVPANDDELTVSVPLIVGLLNVGLVNVLVGMVLGNAIFPEESVTLDWSTAVDLKVASDKRLFRLVDVI